MRMNLVPDDASPQSCAPHECLKTLKGIAGSADVFRICICRQ